jgi:hypothetical protein
MAEPVAVHRVALYFCSRCGGNWDAHLAKARKRLRRENRDRYSGTDLPGLTSIRVREAVDSRDCGW